jgi:hypothetical protein
MRERHPSFSPFAQLASRYGQMSPATGLTPCYAAIAGAGDVLGSRPFAAVNSLAVQVPGAESGRL